VTLSVYDVWLASRWITTSSIACGHQTYSYKM